MELLSLAGLTPGTFIVAILVVGVFAAVVFFLAKRENANTDEVVKSISDENRNLLRNQTFEKAEGNDLYKSNALVASVNTDGEKSKAVLLFYSEAHDSYYTRTVKMSKADAESKGLKEGHFVPVLMKYDKEMHYYDYKKLL